MDWRDRLGRLIDRTPQGAWDAAAMLLLGALCVALLVLMAGCAATLRGGPQGSSWELTVGVSAQEAAGIGFGAAKLLEDREDE